ncbi:CoA pyrophosphatase [Yunchengibacter salinarum]|uniref:CoA pyrophosphatase n=1 Tax=Yunchengibacter salinarum TaxID=3133399 RepID=UPI0035B6240C
MTKAATPHANADGALHSWLQAALRPGNPAARSVRSDEDLMAPEEAVMLGVDKRPPVHRAAVLVPLVDRAAPSVLLTRRADHLSKHAGQVAFPGGRMDPEDPDPVLTALREAEEEVGLHRHDVTVCGRLDRYRTGTGFHVTPVVGVVPADRPLHLDPGEVAEAFEVPLGFLMDRSRHKRRTVAWRGRRRTFFTIDYEGRTIWGATAAMLVNLCDVLETTPRRRLGGPGAGTASDVPGDSRGKELP